MKFQGDILPVKISASAESISHTIEELLELNKKIPARQNEEIMRITEKQFDESDYKTKDKRGEAEGITEKQFGGRDAAIEEIVEVRLEEATPSDGGHKPEAWDLDDVEMKNHKNLAPIWLEVYKNEDERKKLDRGQLNKKIKK